MARAKTTTKRTAMSKGDGFIGARREGSQLVVYSEVISRRHGKPVAEIRRKPLGAVRAKAKVNWLETESLADTLLPAFRAAVKEATSRRGKPSK